MTDYSDTSVPMARTVIIYWTPGHDLSIETTGDWQVWEVEAALDEAREIYAGDSEDAEQ